MMSKIDKEQNEDFFYIVKYWATQGIFKWKCKIFYDFRTRKESYVRPKIGFTNSNYVIDRDAFSEEKDAKKMVSKLRLRKIKSLQKQLKTIGEIDPNNIDIIEEKWK